MPRPAETSDAVLAAVIRASLDCIIVSDAEGRVLRFNPAAEATFGYRYDEVVGRLIGDLIVPPHLRERHRLGMERYLDGGAPHVMGRRVEMEAMRADGTVFPIELAITEAEVAGERVFTASIRDLTARHAAEAALRASEARLRAFMNNAPVGMYLKDGHGRYLMVNPEMTHVFGRPEEELLGRTAADLLAPDEAAMVAAYDRTIRETLKATRVEEHLPGLERYAWTLVVRFPIPGPDGEGVHIGGFDIDVTETRRALEELARSREALHQSEKLTALGSLLAGVAHELNNPLAVLVGEALMLHEDAAEGPFAERAARIGRAAERCARIVRTFLAMARQAPPSMRRLCLNDVVAEALTLVDYGMRSGGIAVHRDLCASLPEVNGDADQLHQVVVNLLLNAQQALVELPGPREIRLRTDVSDDGSQVVLDVADNGPGVPADIRSRIFEPFFTTKPLGAGTGIGLSFCHGVATAHGGEVELLDSPRGATFRLSLPVHERPTMPPPRDEVAAVRVGAALRALVVDDEAEVAETLRLMLGRLGATVDLALSGVDGKALLSAATVPYDLVLCDLRMPGLDGRALHAWVVEQRPEQLAGFAFVTGDSLSAGARRFLADAARPILEKPFTPQSVALLVEAVVRSSRDAP